MNRKRSHDDLEDADECLPISKRINSLHLEGKVHGICHNQDHQFARFHNNNNPESMISSLGGGAGGSIHQYPNHQQQQGNMLPLGHPHHHHQNPTGDKAQTSSSSFPTDYNYNIASNSSLIIPPVHSAYSHPHQLSPHDIYHGASNNAMAGSTNPLMFNVNGDIHHSNNSHHNDNHHHHHHQQNHHHQHQHHHENLRSFYPPHSAGQFINHQMPISSCAGVSLVHNHHATTVADIGLHPDATGTSAANLIPGQLHGPVLEEDLPNGPYEPELGVSENPHYYSNNKLLYEAHLSRLQRILPDYQLHS